MELEQLQQRISELEKQIVSIQQGGTSKVLNLKRHIISGDGNNLILGTVTGTKIGTATTQKLGFYNATPIVRPPSAGTNSAPVENTGTTINYNSTFDGWTVVRLVRALRELGLLA